MTGQRPRWCGRLLFLFFLSLQLSLFLLSSFCPFFFFLIFLSVVWVCYKWVCMVVNEPKSGPSHIQWNLEKKTYIRDSNECSKKSKRLLSWLATLHLTRLFRNLYLDMSLFLSNPTSNWTIGECIPWYVVIQHVWTSFCSHMWWLDGLSLSRYISSFGSQPL